MEKRLVFVGSTNIDLIGYCDHFPEPGETLHGKSFEQGYGGKGGNQAVMAALFGDVPVCFMTCVGKDDFGKQALANYRQYGIDLAYTKTASAATGCAQILVNAVGENFIAIFPGANNALLPDDVSKCADALFAAGCFVVCQNEIPLETTHQVFVEARKRGCTTVWNPAPAPTTFDHTILDIIDILVVNETESKQLGRADDPLVAAQRLAEHCRTVVVTRGKHGCVVVEGKETTTIPTIEVTATDSTGAGDAFVGAFVHNLSIGMEMPDATRFALVVASDSVTRHGTQCSYPSAQRIAELKQTI